MTELPAYLSGLCAMLVIVLVTGWRFKKSRGQIWRVGVVLFLNWFVGLLYVRNTGNYTPWEFSIFIDSAAAFAVMLHPAGRVQVYIGLFYMMQIAWHVGYGLRVTLQKWFGLYLPVDDVLYYDAITYIAWAQLLAVGVWSGWLWSGGRLHNLWDRCHALYRPASVRSDRAK